MQKSRGVLGLEALRRPHLVLADVGRDDRLRWQRREELVEEVGRREVAVFAIVARQRAAQRLGLDGPIVEARHVPVFSSAIERLDRVGEVAVQRDVGRDDLVELAGVDVVVNDRRVAGEAVGRGR